MTISHIAAKVLAGVLAVFGIYFLFQHAGINWETLLGGVFFLVGVWILLDKPISV